MNTTCWTHSKEIPRNVCSEWYIWIRFSFFDPNSPENNCYFNCSAFLYLPTIQCTHAVSTLTRWKLTSADFLAQNCGFCVTPKKLLVYFTWWYCVVWWYSACLGGTERPDWSDKGGHSSVLLRHISGLLYSSFQSSYRVITRFIHTGAYTGGGGKGGHSSTAAPS